MTNDMISPYMLLEVHSNPYKVVIFIVNQTMTNDMISPYMLLKVHSNPYKVVISTKYLGKETTSLMNLKNNSAYCHYTEKTPDLSNSIIKAFQGKTNPNKIIRFHQRLSHLRYIN